MENDMHPHTTLQAFIEGLFIAFIMFFSLAATALAYGKWKSKWRKEEDDR